MNPQAVLILVTRREFWTMIYQAAAAGITVFVTTHYMDEAEYCNRVSIMVDGRIDALDTPTQLKKTYKARSMDEVFLKLARESNEGLNNDKCIKANIFFYPSNHGVGHCSVMDRKRLDD